MATICNGSFQNSSIKVVVIPNSVTTIGEWSFSNSTDLTNVTISDNLTEIGKYAFNNCNKLETINYTGSEEQWNSISKGNGWNLGCPSTMQIVYNYMG